MALLTLTGSLSSVLNCLGLTLKTDELNWNECMKYFALMLVFLCVHTSENIACSSESRVQNLGKRTWGISLLDPMALKFLDGGSP